MDYLYCFKSTADHWGDTLFSIYIWIVEKTKKQKEAVIGPFF